MVAVDRRRQRGRDVQRRVLNRALALLLFLPACALYADDGEVRPDAVVVYPDAPRPPVPPDADPCDGDPACLACQTPAYPTCPPPAPGRVSVCGRVLDVATDELVDGEVIVRFYDALAFAGNPATPPLAATVTLDECNRFVATDVPVPSLGVVAVVVDDPADGEDRLAPTAIAIGPVSSLQIFNRTQAPALTHERDAQWSADAGLEGETFVERGAVLLVLTRDRDPITGASVDDAHYFADLDGRRTTIDPELTATGPSGSAIWTGSVLAPGKGWPADCPPSNARRTPGALFVSRIDCDLSRRGP